MGRGQEAGVLDGNAKVIDVGMRIEWLAAWVDDFVADRRLYSPTLMSVPPSVVGTWKRRPSSRATLRRSSEAYRQAGWHASATLTEGIRRREAVSSARRQGSDISLHSHRDMGIGTCRGRPVPTRIGSQPAAQARTRSAPPLTCSD
jgi:hypothetical protein